MAVESLKVSMVLAENPWMIMRCDDSPLSLCPGCDKSCGLANS